MHKLALAVAVALLTTAGQTASAAQRPLGYQPECNAFISFGFGGPAQRPLALHYGFMMRYEDVADNFRDGRTSPPLFLLDFDAQGSGIAAISGLPFMVHISALHQSSNPGSDPQTTGSYTVIDWGLLGLGIAGIGYGVSQAAGAHDGPGTDLSSVRMGGTLNGIAGAPAAQIDAGLPEPTRWLLFSGDRPLVFGDPILGQDDPVTGRWLDDGTGHMGDLQRRR